MLTNYVEDIEKNFKTSSLEMIEGWIQKDIEKLKKQLEQAKNQKFIAENTEWIDVIYCTRTKLSGQPVTYKVGVHRTPITDVKDANKITLDAKKFYGNQKKELKEYIKFLEETYRVEAKLNKEQLKL